MRLKAAGEETKKGLNKNVVNSNKDEISLEAVMQQGDSELPDFQSFLILWMFERNYLCSEREENKPDSNTILILRFLDGHQKQKNRKLFLRGLYGKSI